MSVWLFDLGNTRLKYARLGADGVPGVVAGSAHAAGGLDPDWLTGLPPRIDEAVVASVASPALCAVLLDALAARGARVTVARTRIALDGVTIAYAEPARFGVDRFLALLAARAGGAGPAMVVGVGTALTVDLLDVDGRHLGGRIAPSPTLMREALHRRVAQLAPNGGVYAEFATDTEDALASGCEGAAVALVQRSLEQASTRVGAVPALLLHGGGAAALQPHLPQARLQPELVLAGLARWHRATARGAA
ncbi:type III pantothenate kinase [Luteimonas deserti]|uniref:Type III pantothenate kinase n=1 Tax=Luteimonas deserti TaxID=2752306 RepID=A0A7Z0QQK7_9GAMM|nr:type III pantothenate kinase [Luteimonas deserti]NYZ62893.1 type III pantothenate kinase [Luteimonas deserti]